MYSSAHTAYYKSWQDITGYDVPYDQCGEMLMVNMPTQWDNIKFFFSYQLNFMYWRYFMWNFAGRQNDIQSSGEIEHGNWITGIPFIDNRLYGDQNMLPQELKDNKGHNVFYCLPSYWESSDSSGRHGAVRKASSSSGWYSSCSS